MFFSKSNNDNIYVSIKICHIKKVLTLEHSVLIKLAYNYLEIRVRDIINALM